MEWRREKSSPVLQYVRSETSGNLFIGFGNRFNTEKVPYTPSGSIGDLVAVFQLIEVLKLSKHLKTPISQRGKTTMTHGKGKQFYHTIRAW